MGNVPAQRVWRTGAPIGGMGAILYLFCVPSRSELTYPTLTADAVRSLGVGIPALMKRFADATVSTESAVSAGVGGSLYNPFAN